MTKILFVLFLLVNGSALANIAEVRKIYSRTEHNEASARELFEKLAAVTTTDNKTLVAYKGAALTLVAKFNKKPAEKIAQFKEGAKLIELAKQKEPANIEIRMIRLSVQENVPKVVKYKMNIGEDKEFLATHYQEQTGPLKEYIINFIMQSKSFSKGEKQSIK